MQNAIFNILQPFCWSVLLVLQLSPPSPSSCSFNYCKLARYVGSQTALRSQMLGCMMMRKPICPKCWRHSNSLAQVWERSQEPCLPGVQACSAVKQQIQEHEIRSKEVHGSAVQDWERPQGPCPPYVLGMQHCHIGSKTVVEGMWQRLGTSMDWSLAIHPYGSPTMVYALSKSKCLSL